MKKNMLGGAVALAVALVAGGAWAADLSYNTAATLTLTGVQSYDNVRIGSGGGTSATIVDATGTTSWTSGSSSTVFYVGAHSSNTSVGTLNLGILNNITASQVTIGGLQPDSNSQTGHKGTVTTLAGGVTTINAGNMAVGTGKSNGGGGTFTLGSGATLNLYGLTGSGSRSSLVVGRWAAFNSHSGNGNVNLSAGIANLYLTELAVGKATEGTGGSGTSVTGQMTLGTSASNHLDVSGAGSVVKVGYNTNASVTSTGTLTIGNLDSTSSVTSTDNSTAILIGSKGSGAASGTLNLTGGTLKITTTGAAIAGGGGTTRALNLAGTSAVKLIAGASSSDWIHSLSAAVINSNGVTIDTDGKTIGISQAFTGGGGLIKDGAGTMTLSTAQGYTGATEVKAGELNLTGSLHASSAVTVKSGAAIGGAGTVNGSLAFDSGANLRYGASPLNVTGNVTFGGFSVANILGFDFALANLNTPYTLIAGSNVSLTNVANIDVASAYDVGGGRKAYFQTGSLQLMVIPEPATFGIVLSALAAAIIRRKRFG